MTLNYEQAVRLTDATEQMNYLMSLPRIGETEWDTRFGWMPDCESGDYHVMDDTPEVRRLLAQHDHHYVWSQIDGGDADRGLIVPGFLPHATGWYLCERPWSCDAPVVAIIGD